MIRRKPDLIVPVRDRRQRKRYLTLRNARNALIALAVLFVGITIRSELQPRRADSFGRLLEREMPVVEARPMEIVKEAAPPVVDQTAPDPMLVAPQQREQWLYDDSATTSASLEPVAPPVPAIATAADGRSRYAIVGGPEGVSLVQQTRERRTLRGGFGR